MKIFVANWKMQLTLAQQIEYCEKHLEEIKAWKHKIILCPSFPALVTIGRRLHKTDVALGAQSCSDHPHGPYTGQVSASSLAQAGCSYVLVGHSEERALGVTDDVIAKKALRVLEAGLIPIVCIGETLEQKKHGATREVLEYQLQPIHEVVKKAPFYIAYEPVWAIGSGQTPTPKELEEILAWLKHTNPNAGLLYGGSVTPETIETLSQLPFLHGFLVGGASTDFQQFKKIVSLVA